MYSEDTKDVKSEQTTTPTETTKTLPAVVETKPADPRDDDMGLKFFDKDFLYDCMSVPTDSYNEFRMVTYVVRYCVKHHIKYEFDEFGNIYLTKGELNEGEYYPCVTAHLDTVQHRQFPFAKSNVRLPLITTVDDTYAHKGKHKVSVEGMGIGADDKGGVCIGLAMFNHQPVLKAVFFLQEEVGMIGSKHMDKSWFDNVGYVIGYDSPDLNRAAWKSSGTKLFDGKFYKNHLKPICDKWGMTDFRSEPFTDVSIVAKETDIICMNFGNGGYLAHSSTEYIIVEDMEHALGMGSAIIDGLGKVRYTLQHKTEDYDDNHYLDTLSSTYRSYPSYNPSTPARKPTTTTVSKPSEEDIKKVKYETLEYVAARYENFIASLIKDFGEKASELLSDSPEKKTEMDKFLEGLSSDEITF